MLDNKLIELAKPALDRAAPVYHELAIANTDRTVGAMLSGEVARRYGMSGLPDETIHFKFNGSAGQSFAAFLAAGIRLSLEGDANDYLGKGLSGGRVVVRPPKEALFRAEENIIAGNTLCYGAICGEVYIRGIVGERFCVRNSGAHAVVEGAGDHACEYMTGGRVVILGATGRNFAGGMSGGIAYVYDPGRRLPHQCSKDMVDLEIPNSADIMLIRRLVERHAWFTDSPVAQAILDDWGEKVGFFVKVMPVEYRRVLEHQAEIEERARKLAEHQTAV